MRSILVIEIADFCVYGKITLNVGHLHFVDLFMCGSCLEHCLYLLVLGSQRFFLKVSSQFKLNIGLSCSCLPVLQFIPATKITMIG